MSRELRPALSSLTPPSRDVKPELYTYGLPRVGDHTFSQGLGSRVELGYRLTHNRDVVRMHPVPPNSAYITQRIFYLSNSARSYGYSIKIKFRSQIQ